MSNPKPQRPAAPAPAAVEPEVAPEVTEQNAEVAEVAASGTVIESNDDFIEGQAVEVESVVTEMSGVTITTFVGVQSYASFVEPKSLLGNA